MTVKSRWFPLMLPSTGIIDVSHCTPVCMCLLHEGDDIVFFAFVLVFVFVFALVALFICCVLLRYLISCKVILCSLWVYTYYLSWTSLAASCHCVIYWLSSALWGFPRFIWSNLSFLELTMFTSSLIFQIRFLEYLILVVLNYRFFYIGFLRQDFSM